MSCEHLICARCSGPVVEAGCPVCRAGRARVHQPQNDLTPVILAALLMMFVLVMIAWSVAGP